MKRAIFIAILIFMLIFSAATMCRAQIPVIQPTLYVPSSEAFCWWSREITIDNTKVVGGSDFTNFTVLFSGTYAWLKSVPNGGKVTDAQADDIWFSTDLYASSLLDWEIEYWNPSTGEIVAWIRIPTLTTSSDYVFYITFGDATRTTFTGDVNGTWNSDYKFVQHFPDPSSLDFTESTSNGYASVNNGATTTTGKMGGGVSFNGSSQSYHVTDLGNAISGDNTVTISGWVKPESPALDMVWHGFGNDMQLYHYPNSSGFQVRWGNSERTYSSVSPTFTDAWHYLVFVKTSTGNNGILYIDGTAQSPSSGTISSTTTSADQVIYFGSYGNGFSWFDGDMDEQRINATALSADWIATEYNNQNSPSTFYSISGEDFNVCP